jgi:hypothetical protein
MEPPLVPLERHKRYNQYLLVEVTRLYSNPNMSPITAALLGVLRLAVGSRRPPEPALLARRIIRKLTAENRAKIVARHLAGDTIKGLAREYGVAPQTVRKCLAKEAQ